jgi:hypothetical protein
MALNLIQRYVLVANGPVQPVALSSTQGATATTVAVPLSGHWTINLAMISGAAYSQDNSGSLSMETIGLTWQFLNNSGSILFSLLANRSIVTPPLAFPKQAGAALTDWADTNQVISSLDQFGGVVTQVQASTNGIFVNSDAGAAHSVQMQINAVIEFLHAAAL